MSEKMSAGEFIKLFEMAVLDSNPATNKEGRETLRQRALEIDQAQREEEEEQSHE